MLKIKIILILFFIFKIETVFAKQKIDSYEDEFEMYDVSFSKEDEKEIYDPIEKVNRGVFQFNDKFDLYLAEPIAKSYKNYVPKFARKSIRNFLANLTLPISTINSLAQGKLNNGLATFSNFLINSTLGIGGLFDIASNKNIKYNKEDFGQTLAYYKVESGPFLVIPILGPSTLRDATGLAADTSVDIMGFNALKIGGSHEAFIENEARIGYSVLSGIDKRENLIDVIDEARKDSFDLYAAMRSLYIQNRNSNIEK